MRETMTYAEAVGRMLDQPVPGFWVADSDRIAEEMTRLRRGDVSVVAESPGGYPLWLVTYGDREVPKRHANFNSAVAARAPEAYADKAARTRPVLYFVGPVHGHETEGLTGLLSLIRVMETGHDLQGRPQPELQRLGEQCRLVILPTGNPDGLARFEPRLLNGMGHDDIRFWGQGTDARDVLWGWPGCKSQHPMVGPHVGFLGCYFNDQGVNPMHDEWFGATSAEVTALLRVARQEAPDLITVLHSHQAPPAVLRPGYVPLEVQAEVGALAARVYALLDALSLRHGRPFEPQAEMDPRSASFNLVPALYHTSGAPTFTFECPHGTVGADAYTVEPEQILDIQLTLYRAMLQHVLGDRAAGVAR